MTINQHSVASFFLISTHRTGAHDGQDSKFASLMIVLYFSWSNGRHDDQGGVVNTVLKIPFTAGSA